MNVEQNVPNDKGSKNELVEALFADGDKFFQVLKDLMRSKDIFYDGPPRLDNIVVVDRFLANVHDALDSSRERLARATESEILATAEEIWLFSLRAKETVSGVYQRKMIAFFKPLIDRLQQLCVELETPYFSTVRHRPLLENEVFAEAFLNDFAVVDRIVEGGRSARCLWRAVSASLFGDHRAEISLRLLAAAVLVEHEAELLASQRDHFGAGLRFDDVVAAAFHGKDDHRMNDYQLLALSLALRRPLVCYGHFLDIPPLPGVASFADMTRADYAAFRGPGHHRYVGHSVDEGKEPILFHMSYNGKPSSYSCSSYYYAILPKSADSWKRLWLPQTLLFAPLLHEPRRASRVESGQTDSVSVGTLRAETTSASVSVLESDEVEKSDEKDSDNDVEGDEDTWSKVSGRPSLIDTLILKEGQNRFALATQAFVGENKWELSVEEGDIVVVTNLMREDWWIVRNESGQTGFVSASVLQRLN